MQRLSKAVEDTAKDAQNAAADAVAAADASMEAPVSASDAVSVEDVTPIADGGHEESKSSDDEGERVEDKEVEQKAPSAAAKWHRELCSLAEMGFENTIRNISLLEKHVTTSGGPGMER